MRLYNLLKTSGIAALAAAMAITALPAEALAQDRGRGQEASERGDRQNRGEARGNRGDNRRGGEDRRSARSMPNDANINRVRAQARQVDDRSERRAERIEQRGDRAARQAAREGEYRRAARIDRQGEQRAVRVEQRGDRRAAQVRVQGREGNRDRGWDRRDRNSNDRNRDRNWNDGDRSRGDRDRNWNDRNRDRDWSDRNRGRDWNDRDNRARNDWRNDRARDYRRWDNRGWRNDRRYDWHNYRSRNRSAFRLGVYYAPHRSYSYRRVGIGFHLDSLFFGNRYWISDPGHYRLPEVYGPYRWVRYYDDVLLVDTYTGEVVDVIYDFFW